MQWTGKVKEGKVSPNHDVKEHMDRRGIAPLILNLGPNSFTPPPGKNPGSHQIVDWTDPRACLTALGKAEISSPYRDSNTGPSSP